MCEPTPTSTCEGGLVDGTKFFLRELLSGVGCEDALNKEEYDFCPCTEGPEDPVDCVLSEWTIGDCLGATCFEGIAYPGS